MNEKQLESAKLLYNSLGLNVESIENDIDNDYLTVNTARNGREVVWYVDENCNGAIYVGTDELLSSNEIEKELC